MQRNKTKSSCAIESLESRRLLSAGFKLTTLASLDDPSLTAEYSSFGPSGSVVLDSAGDIFGTTTGQYFAGYQSTIFEIVHGSGEITMLATLPFGAASSLTIDSSGNLFCACAFDDPQGGEIVELPKGSNAPITLATFNASSGSPEGPLTLDSSGDVFGVIPYGGPYGSGTVFEIPPGSNAVIDIADFNGTNGGLPHGGLLLDSAGDLFGITNFTAFEIQHGTHDITTLANFGGGNQRTGPLVADSSGNLYGTDGDANGDGQIFEVAHGTHGVSIIGSLAGSNVGFSGDLAIDSSGNLYDYASDNAAAGNTEIATTLFEIPHGTTTLSTLFNFTGANAIDPLADVPTFDSNGDIYGVTIGNTVDGPGGGAYGEGSVFELSPITAVPAAPTGLSAHLASSGTVNLSWKENGASATSYRVERRYQGVAAFTTLATLPAGSVSYADTSALFNVGYDYRVVAVDSAGSAASAIVAITTLTPPAAPTMLTASLGSNTAVDLAWKDSATNATGYLVERRYAGTTAFTTIATLPAGSTAFCDATALLNVTYDYRVVAINAAGSAASAVIAVRTKP